MPDKTLINCPSERSWDELAAGLISGIKADGLLQHASWCQPCAATLAAAIELFRPETVVIPMPMAGKRIGIWLGAIAASLAFICVGWWMLLQSEPLSALARAYTNQRTFEPRISGAEFGRFSVDRSSAKGLSSRPQALLEVASRIGPALASKPRDPLWLHAKGRLALLDDKPDEAIQPLRTALDLDAANKVISIDLATAYYLRALRRGDQGTSDLTLAQELLGEVLKQEPENTTALFNRALVETEMHQLTQAIADLEKMISLERSDGWRQEAQERLEKVRKKKTAFFNRDPSADRQRFAEIALEHYLNLGLWLSGEDSALITLAAKLEQQHGDTWLRDLLALPRNQKINDSIRRLASLTGIRLTALRGRYLSEQAETSPLETAVLPPPLAAWRDFELEYRGTHSGGAFPCKSLQEISYHYKWLAAQRERESGVCDSLKGNIATAIAKTERSRDFASKAGMVLSSARSEAILGALEYRQGKYREAMKRQRALFGRMLEQGLPVARSHEPLYILMASSRALQRYHAASSAASIAVEAAHASGFWNAEFGDLIDAADLALKIGDYDQTAKLYHEAIRIYESSNKGAVPPSYRAWAEVVMAEATSDFERVRPFEAVLDSTEDPFVRLPYQRLRARQEELAGQRLAARRRLEVVLDWLMHRAEQGAQLVWLQESKQTVDQLLNLLLKDGLSGQAFQLVQRVRARNEESLRKGPIRHVGSRSHTLFLLRMIGDRVIIWRSGKLGVNHRTATATAAEVAQQVRRVWQAASSRETSIGEIRMASNRLTETLMGTWLQELPENEDVVFQAEGNLSGIPFALLKGNKLELGRERAIAIAIGPTGAGNGAAQTFSGATLLVDATRAPGLEKWGVVPLPEPVEEIEALKRLGRGANILQGQETKSGQVRLEMGKASLMHFAGHGIRYQGQIGLLLADGVLQLEGAAVPPRVILSACATGRRHQEEEDTLTPESLAESFILGGAAEVVASNWDLDTRAAAVLMEHLYGGMQKGKDMGTALLESVRELARGKEFAHPYFWAGAMRLVRL